MGSARFFLLALRLGLFQACLGALSVLTLGIFNRLLIEEFAVPAALTALALGCQQLVAFSRVWFGQRSDRCRWNGLRRTPFIIGGAAAFCVLTWIAGRLVLWIAAASMLDDTSAVIGRGLILAVVFLLYGLAISASSTPFAALLVDVSTEKQRPALVSIVWSMLMVGIVAGAIILSSFLGSACASAELTDVIDGVGRLIAIAPVVIFGLVLIAITGVEPRISKTNQVGQGQSNDNDQEISLSSSWRILRASPQVGYFFAVLSLFTFSLFLQEAVLEPYGGAIFAMDVCATTRLNAIWGVGTLLGIATTGFLFVPRLGAQRTALVGGVVVGGFRASHGGCRRHQLRTTVPRRTVFLWYGCRNQHQCQPHAHAGTDFPFDGWNIHRCLGACSGIRPWARHHWRWSAPQLFRAVQWLSKQFQCLCRRLHRSSHRSSHRWNDADEGRHQSVPAQG